MTNAIRELNPSKSETRPRLVGLIRAYVDIILGGSGAGCVTVALIVLVGWPYALLTGGVALIVLAMVVPEWD